MRTHDAQRAEDARQKAALRTDAQAAREARIAELWRDEVDMPTIAERLGVSQVHVSDVLDRLGLRKKVKGLRAKK